MSNQLKGITVKTYKSRKLLKIISKNGQLWNGLYNKQRELTQEILLDKKNNNRNPFLIGIQSNKIIFQKNNPLRNAIIQNPQGWLKLEEYKMEFLKDINKKRIFTKQENLKIIELLNNKEINFGIIKADILFHIFEYKHLEGKEQTPGNDLHKQIDRLLKKMAKYPDITLRLSIERLIDINTAIQSKNLLKISEYNRTYKNINPYNDSDLQKDNYLNQFSKLRMERTSTSPIRSSRQLSSSSTLSSRSIPSLS